MAGAALTFLAGKPISISVPCAGLDPGGQVTIKVFEPHALGADPLETIQGTVDEQGGSAVASWTYDYDKYKDKVSASVFVFVVEGASRVSISGVCQFVERFQVTIKDETGHPAANRLVMLHAARGPDVPTASNGKGNVDVMVPPGTYQVEVLGAAPPDMARPPESPSDDAATSAGQAPADDAATDEAQAPDDAAPAEDAGPHPALPVPAAVFAFDSAFPGPGVFAHLRRIDDAATQQPDARLVVFGHTDKKGSDDYNKGLSDRRAKAVLALLTNDRDLFDAIATKESWGTGHYQAMLRGIGCNPGEIDGQGGPLTEAAVRAFQREYNANVFNDATPRAHGDVPVDGQLGDDTRAAIRDAYVVGTPGNVPASRFAGPRFAGCSDFNFVSDKDEENRRVVVALFKGSAPADSDFPCKEGNAKACPVDAQRPMRCTFYRDLVEEQPATDTPYFFDFQWLRKKDGSAILSALTTLPDGTAATFTIHKCDKSIPKPPPESSSGKPRPDPGTVLGTVDGKIAGGVCFATWTPPDGYDPFDSEAWFIDHDMTPEEWKDGDDTGSKASIDSVLQLQGMQPPVFAIDAGGQWGFSRPPGQRINRIVFGDDASPTGRALSADGGVVNYSGGSPRLDIFTDIDVVSVAVQDRKVHVPTPDSDDSQGAGAASG
jgi:outer membrane protein OmpA-like peptidoglycan-associated protein